MVIPVSEPWPSSAGELVAFQRRLAADAERARDEEPWTPDGSPMIGGCFVAFARGEAGPGHPGDRAWAAAVVWAPSREDEPRHIDDHLRGQPIAAEPRQADDVIAQHVLPGEAPAAYQPGLLALREGPLLAAAVSGLDVVPDVLLVDATGIDHPRRAGLAVHLGAVIDVPTVGVTHRGLTVRDEPPELDMRGASTPVAGRDVTAVWLCTRSRARPVLVHPGWRTRADTAVEVVLAASTNAARSPVPLQEARRVAREGRAIAGAG